MNKFRHCKSYILPCCNGSLQILLKENLERNTVERKSTDTCVRISTDTSIVLELFVSVSDLI